MVITIVIIKWWWAQMGFRYHSNKCDMKWKYFSFLFVRTSLLPVQVVWAYIHNWQKCYILLGLLLLLSHFSHVQLCATPQTAAHQAPPSLGFSRQEHWSELPFPSSMCESEKWKWSRSVVSESSRPHGLQLTRLLCPWDFPGKSTGVGCHCLLQEFQ